MSIIIRPATLADKQAIAAMLQDYLRELSQYFAPDQPKADHYDYPYLDDYWMEPGERFPFLISAEGETAGFAFVNCYSRLGQDNTWSMAEFYVLPDFRRAGVGVRAAEEIFRLFPGGWEVAVLASNDPAHTFWPHVMARVATNSVVAKTTSQWKGVIFTFNVSANKI